MSFIVKRVNTSPLAVVRAQKNKMYLIIWDKRLTHE